MAGIATVLLEALAKGLSIYDRHLATKYAEEYRQLHKILRTELAKPIVRNEAVDCVRGLRDQNKIDHAYADLKILLERFLKEEDQ